MIIRECIETDLAQVVSLSEQWAKEHITLGYENVSWSVGKLRHRLNGYFFVAEADQKIIGYTFGEIRIGQAQPVIAQDERYIEIFEVYVESSYRSQGVGQQLVEYLQSRGEADGVTRMLVGSSNRNWSDTIRFYEKQGFNMWYVQMYK